MIGPGTFLGAMTPILIRSDDYLAKSVLLANCSQFENLVSPKIRIVDQDRSELSDEALPMN